VLARIIGGPDFLARLDQNERALIGAKKVEEKSDVVSGRRLGQLERLGLIDVMNRCGLPVQPCGAVGTVQHKRPRRAVVAGELELDEPMGCIERQPRLASADQFRIGEDRRGVSGQPLECLLALHAVTRLPGRPRLGGFLRQRSAFNGSHGFS